MEKGSDGTAQGDISLGAIHNNSQHRNGNRDEFLKDILVHISPSIHSPTEVQIALMVCCDTAVNHTIGTDRIQRCDLTILVLSWTVRLLSLQLFEEAARKWNHWLVGPHIYERGSNLKEGGREGGERTDEQPKQSNGKGHISGCSLRMTNISMTQVQHIRM